MTPPKTAVADMCRAIQVAFLEGVLPRGVGRRGLLTPRAPPPAGRVPPKTGILQLRERSWPRWRVLPNESRLSCGRSARQRKATESQRKRLAGEATQFFPHERPPASSAC